MIPFASPLSRVTDLAQAYYGEGSTTIGL